MDKDKKSLDFNMNSIIALAKEITDEYDPNEECRKANAAVYDYRIRLEEVLGDSEEAHYEITERCRQFLLALRIEVERLLEDDSRD